MVAPESTMMGKEGPNGQQKGWFHERSRAGAGGVIQPPLQQT